MKSLVEDLLEIKESIETKEKQKSILEGKLESYMEMLAKDFGCSSIKEAEKQLNKLEKEMGLLNASIIEIVEKLKGYGWNIA